MATPGSFATNFPPIGQDLVDRQSGKVDRTWALFFQHLSAGVPAGGSGGLTEVITEVITAATVVPWHWTWNNTITDAQVKALPTTYQQVVAAPGAGKILVPAWALLVISLTAGHEYTNVDPGPVSGLGIVYGDWDADAFTLTTSWTGGALGQLLAPAHAVPAAATLIAGAPDQTAIDVVPNAPFKLAAWNDPGNYTGGHASNVCRVGVAYHILDTTSGAFV